MAEDPKIVTEARAALGARLAALRAAGGYTQETFAPKTFYGRSSLANIETGRQKVPREFWALCDDVLKTGGLLAREHDRIAELRIQYQRSIASGLSARVWRSGSSRHENPLVLFAHPVTYVRHERGWSQREFADRFRRDREEVGRWESGSTVPDQITQREIAQELGVPEDTVEALGWPYWLPTGHRVDPTVEWSWDAALAALDREAESAMLDRRAFLTLSGTALAALTDQWINTDAPRLMPALHGGRLDSATVECFEQRLPIMRSLDASLGGAGVRGVVDSQLRLATDLLLSGRYDERTGRRMAAVAGELGRLAGYASFDSGHHAAAERYWAAALRASHAADDRLLGANILKCMSLQRVDLNQPSYALSMAGSALAAAQHAHPRVVAMLTVRLARTYAAARDRSASERLLASADTAISRVDGQVAPGWSAYFDEAEYCAQAAACYRLMSRPAEVEFWLAKALELQPPSRTRDRATYRIWRAENFLDLQDVEQACEVARSALPDLQTSRSARNTRRVRRLRGRLELHRSHSEVRPLLEQLDVLERA